MKSFESTENSNGEDAGVSGASLRDTSVDKVEATACPGRRYTFTLGQVHDRTHFSKH